MTILVVEDDPTVLAFVDRMLTLGRGPVLHKPFTSDDLLKAIGAR